MKASIKRLLFDLIFQQKDGSAPDEEPEKFMGENI